MKRFIFFFVVFATAACSRYPADVERALKLAGDNRAELEKVLAHYGQRPEDELKLQSAYFLIANMPYHYTVEDARMDSFRTYLRGIEPDKWTWATFEKEVYPAAGKIEIKPDLYHITSEYLIRNIDFSFQVWQETPWGKYVSFADFCEDILPYRVSHEPLEYWKEAYHAFFRPIIDTMAHNHDTEAICVQLLNHLNEQGWAWGQDMVTYGFGALTMLHKRVGACAEQAEFVTYILRSLGIPSGIDMVIREPLRVNSKHWWNYIHNIEGKMFAFDFYDEDIYENGNRERKYGKVYRQNYALQRESLPVKHKDKYIPQGDFKNVLLRDVTSEYFPDTHISIRSKFSRKDLAYLCVFGGNTWIPVAWCKPEGGVAEFRNIEPDILYQVRLIDETRDVAASNPFILLDSENLQFFYGDTTDFQTLTLLRKYPKPEIMPHHFNYKAIGGKFQGANRPDFSDATTLHTIPKAADFSWEYLQPENTGKFKYVRYLSAKDGFNLMAEVQFYSDGQQLHGNVIGTNDSTFNTIEGYGKHAVFDNDPLTFFFAGEADGSWSGLELDKAYTIDAIRYIFRNDDNSIRVGDTYELLYLNGDQWLSAGRQTADTTILRYEKVPSNTLYWLRDHTRGREERPFTYEDGQQIWW